MNAWIRFACGALYGLLAMAWPLFLGSGAGHGSLRPGALPVAPFSLLDPAFDTPLPVLALPFWGAMAVAAGALDNAWARWILGFGLRGGALQPFRVLSPRTLPPREGRLLRAATTDARGLPPPGGRHAAAGASESG